MENNENNAPLVTAEQMIPAVQQETPKNRVTIVFMQDTVKEVTRKGEVILKPVKHHMAFSDAVETKVTSEDVANFIVAKLFQYQELQKLQGRKARFDTTLPIHMTISVNGQERASDLKFSTNVKTLAKLLETTPRLLGYIYNPTSLGLGTTAKQIMDYVKNVNYLLADDPKKQLEKQPAINTDAIEELEEVSE